MGGLIYSYCIEGVFKIGITEDGGQQCYDQIPKAYHLTVTIIGCLIHCWFIYKWDHEQSPLPPKPLIRRNNCQLMGGLLGLLIFSATAYLRGLNGTMIWLLNPCHVTVLIQATLSLAPNTPLFQKVHTYWSAWVFGAMLALAIPHTYGLSLFEVIVFYLEHCYIFPFGPLLLYRRFGFLKPTLTNQLASYSSIMVYHLTVLMFVGITTMVSINFVLCHSPFDPFSPYIGYHQFTAYIIFTNFVSYVGRWASYFIVLPLKFLKLQSIKQ